MGKSMLHAERAKQRERGTTGGRWRGLARKTGRGE